MLRQLCIDVSVSHQAVRCGFIFVSHSGSMANKDKTADDRLKAHPKGANQRVQHHAVTARYGTTLASQRRFVLNTLVYADTDILDWTEY